MFLQSLAKQDIVYCNPKIATFKDMTYTIMDDKLEIQQNGRVVSRVKLPLVMGTQDNGKINAKEIKLLNRDWVNKKAVAAIEGKIIFTNGPELYLLQRTYDE